MADRRKVVINLFWKLLEKTGAQGISFIVSIVLARKMLPEAFGTIALVTVIISLMQVFIDSGLGNSLIQKLDADNKDFSTVFYVNVSLCLVLYCGLFYFAPAIATFYENNELIDVIRVLGLTVIISGVKNIQQAYIAKKMIFKKQFYSTILGASISAIVSISMAYAGYGVWALVAQTLISNTIDTLVLWIIVKWRPEMYFSFSRLKVLFSYGWKLLAISLLETIYNDVSQLIIGKKFSESQLALYNRGRQFPNFIVTNINSSIKSVMFPVFSEGQQDSRKLKQMMRRSIQVSNFAISPLIIGMAAVSESFIELVLTESWLGCVPYLRLFCISYLFHPIQTTNKSAIKAMGNSALLLKVQVWVRIIGLGLLIVGANFGVMVMTCSVVLTSLIEQFLLSVQNKKLIGYGYLEQCKDMMPAIVMAAIMGIVVHFMNYLDIVLILKLVLQVIVGGLIYIGGMLITKNQTMRYIIQIFMSK